MIKKPDPFYIYNTSIFIYDYEWVLSGNLRDYIASNKFVIG